MLCAQHSSVPSILLGLMGWTPSPCGLEYLSILQIWGFGGDDAEEWYVSRCFSIGAQRFLFRASVAIARLSRLHKSVRIRSSTRSELAVRSDFWRIGSSLFGASKRERAQHD